MSVRASLFHLTRYRYDRPVWLSPQVIRLRPAPSCRTPVLSYALQVFPRPHHLNWIQDPQGNLLARVVFPGQVSEFRIEVNLVADLAPSNPFDFFVEQSAESFPFTYAAEQQEELHPFLTHAGPGPLLAGFLAGLDRTPRGTVDALVDLNRRVAETVGYVVRAEPGVQAPEETLRLGSGSCRDSAWLLVHCLRQLGVAARFVSGYLIQLHPDAHQQRGATGTELHAWADAFIPGAGWIGFDATSGLLAGEGHVPLCATPRSDNAAPVSGSHEPCEVEFSHEVRITSQVATPG